MQVPPAQGSERWDFYLAQQTWQGGAPPAAHSLTPLHFAKNSSFNPELKHHPFQKAFPACLPTPTPPTEQGKGPHTLLPLLTLPTCHSPSPAISREEMLCLCVGLRHQLWAPEGWNWLAPCSTSGAQNQAKQTISPQGWGKVQLKWTELELELIFERQVGYDWTKGRGRTWYVNKFNSKWRKYMSEDWGAGILETCSGASGQTWAATKS